MIEQEGETALRVNEIARAAGIAKPSLYHFFGSREGLIAAAQAERYRRAMLVGYEEVIARIEQGMTAEELMTLMYAWNESFTGEEAQHRRAVRLAVLGSSVSRPDLREEIAKVDRRVEQYLVDLITLVTDRGWVHLPSTIRPFDLAVWLNGLWNGRYGADIDPDPAAADGWDRVTNTVLTHLLFSSVSPPQH